MFYRMDCQLTHIHLVIWMYVFVMAFVVIFLCFFLYYSFTAMYHVHLLLLSLLYIIRRFVLFLLFFHMIHIVGVFQGTKCAFLSQVIIEVFDQKPHHRIII